MKIICFFFMFFLTLSSYGGTIFDNFSDGDFNGWETISFIDAGGVFSVKNEELVIQRASIWSCGLYIGEEDWKNYSVELDATIKQKLADWCLVGLGLRLQGNAQQWKQSWMSYGFRPEGVLASLVVYDNPNWLQDIKKPIDFEIGKTYHLKGVVYENNYEFYVDGELVLETQENRLPSGKPGVYVNGANAVIDNILIKGEDLPETNLSVQSGDTINKLIITWSQVKEME